MNGEGKTTLPLSSILPEYSPMNVIISYRLSRLVTKLGIFFHFIPPLSNFFHNDFNNAFPRACGPCCHFVATKSLASLPKPHRPVFPSPLFQCLDIVPRSALCVATSPSQCQGSLFRAIPPSPVCETPHTWNSISLPVSRLRFWVCVRNHTEESPPSLHRSAWPPHLPRCAKLLTPGNGFHCPSAVCVFRCA